MPNYQLQVQVRHPSSNGLFILGLTRSDWFAGIVIGEVKLKPRPRLVPNFIDREDILEAMQDAHFNNHHVQIQMITILSGIGGLGKTQLALKFALKFEEM